MSRPWAFAACGGSVGLAKKMNFTDSMKVRVVGKPAGVDLDDVVTTTSAKADGVLVFVKKLADVDAKCGPVLQAASRDGLAWIAYPKAGQLGTDLNRDILWKHLLAQGIQGVRQIAVDDVWSAMRFRPASTRR
jgi:hypothetical protein